MTGVPLRTLFLASILALSACGSNGENRAGKDLEDAAAQSDPAAAAVINQAIEGGMNEQEALARAGQAASANAQASEGRPASGTVQAVPNTVQTPNLPDGTSPPAKGTGSTDIPGLQQGSEPRQPQPSGG